MINVIISNAIRFFIFGLLQVLIIRNINFGTYFVPLLHLIIILLLPLKIPKIPVLFICFILGLILDIFYDQQGLHSAALVFMGFMRPLMLSAVAPREGYDDFMKPTTQSMGLAWFVTYSGILIFLHHLFFFFSEIFRFDEFGSTLLRVFCSTISTFVLVLVFQYLFYRHEKSTA